MSSLSAILCVCMLLMLAVGVTLGDDTAPAPPAGGAAAPAAGATRVEFGQNSVIGLLMTLVAALILH